MRPFVFMKKAVTLLIYERFQIVGESCTLLVVSVTLTVRQFKTFLAVQEAAGNRKHENFNLCNGQKRLCLTNQNQVLHFLLSARNKIYKPIKCL